MRDDSNASSLASLMGVKTKLGGWRRSPASDSRFSGSLDGKLALSLAIIEPSDLTMKERIGSGSFADVNRGVYGGAPVAIKQLRGFEEEGGDCAA